MARFKVVSFDMEGTLIDETFSRMIWETDIPRLYAEKHGLGLDEAKKRVFCEYDDIGECRPEWYDVDYWFKRFSLMGNWRDLLIERRDYCKLYPEVPRVLKRMGEKFTLIIASNTIREFLELQLDKIPDVFAHVFSATSDFKDVKKSAPFYKEICRMIGVKPEETIHIGDHHRYDYEEASNAGLKAYYLDRSRSFKTGYSVWNLKEFERRVMVNYV